MKRFAVIASLALVFFVAPVIAEESEPLRTISVTGTVQTQVAPDMVVWRISLSETDPELSKAKAASDASVKAIIGLRNKLDIDEGDLQTGTMSISKEYHEDERGRRLEFKHFRVYRNITIRQRDLKRLDEFIDAFVASADLEVSFSYEYSKIHETRAETRLEALKIARAKAADLAEVVGAKLGKVLTIDEHASDGGDRWNSIHMQNAYTLVKNPGVDQAGGTFVPGAIDVSMTMYATFELE